MKSARWLVCVWLVLLLASLVAPVGAANAPVRVLEIEGPVTPAMLSYFERGIRAAESERDAALVIELDTPGGQLNLTQDAIQLIRAARVPVIVYIAPRGAQAASAGTLITLAAHAAVMAPETVIGAASPVGGSGEELGETMRRKLIEDMKATARALAERRGGEAVALAEAAIEEAQAVHATEALAAGLVDLVADDMDALLSGLDGKVVEVAGQEWVLATAGATMVEQPMTWLEQLMHALVDSTIVAILMAIGVQAIIIELSTPGGWVPGFIGVVSLALGLYGLGVLPVNWLGLGLVVIAFVLFFLDIKAPTHGALTAAGIVTLVAGFVILFNYPGSPEFARVSIPVVVAIGLMTGGFFAFVVAKALRAQTRPPVTGAEGLIGAIGEVRVPLAPVGSVLVRGERWRAAAEDSSTIPAGARVQVTAVRGFQLAVRRVDNNG